jgi:hypothetical protein
MSPRMKDPPGRAGGSEAEPVGNGGDSPKPTTAAAPTCATDVWKVVGRASIADLACAVGAPPELGPLDRDMPPLRGLGTRENFACPECGGRAGAVSAARWHCHACRRRGTVAELARHVAESPDALEALVRPCGREEVAV